MKYGVNLPLMRRHTIDFFILKYDIPLIGFEETGNDTQNSSLSAARRTQQRDKLPVPYIKAQIVEHLIITQFDGDVFQIDNDIFFQLCSPSLKRIRCKPHIKNIVSINIELIRKKVNRFDK